MKVKCLDCGHIGGSAIFGPKITLDGRESQSVPACAKCRSGRITKVG